MSEDDDGSRWVILAEDGRFLCCWFAGEPEWCHLKVNAKRHTAREAGRALQALEAVGQQAAGMAEA